METIVNTEPLGHNVDLAERAYRIRRNALRMGEVQGQGYIGLSSDWWTPR
jgi:transketolase